jgi:tetratricopeptide (TPR) repeat protein
MRTIAPSCHKCEGGAIRYGAVLGSDSKAMAEQQQWFAGSPDTEHFGLSLASDTEAYLGHLGKAQELTRRSIDSAIPADSKETGALWQEIAAQREAAFGNMVEARQQAAEGLKLYTTSQSVTVEAALAFAMAGNFARAESLAQDLNKRFPLDTQMQSLWLPAIRAQLALDRKNPADALGALQAAAPPIELGSIQFVSNLSCLYPTYIRGEAYLAAGQGKAAAAEFQRVLDHSGIVWNCWTGALAHLGVARANALQAKISQGADADAARVRVSCADCDDDKEVSMVRERALKAVLVVVGLLFTAGVIPLTVFFSREPAVPMIMSIYVTLGIFLLLAVRDPAANRSLIAFGGWANLAHAGVMAAQEYWNVIERRELAGVVVFAIVGVVLVALAPAKQPVERVSAAVV